MELTTASMDLKVDQARTKKVKLNQFIVRGGVCFIQIDSSWIQVYLWLLQHSLSFSDPLLIEGLSHYIALFGPS